MIQRFELIRGSEGDTPARKPSRLVVLATEGGLSAVLSSAILPKISTLFTKRVSQRLRTTSRASRSLVSWF
jgi:hypothetical protein